MKYENAGMADELVATISDIDNKLAYVSAMDSSSTVIVEISCPSGQTKMFDFGVHRGYVIAHLQTELQEQREKLVAELEKL